MNVNIYLKGSMRLFESIPKDNENEYLEIYCNKRNTLNERPFEVYIEETIDSYIIDLYINGKWSRQEIVRI
jgi:hypothetical protein